MLFTEAGNHMYLKYLPNKKLETTVDRYWIYSNTQQKSISIEILPDHCFDWIFIIKGNTIYDVVITGIWTQIQTIEIPAKTTYVGINFYPNGLINYFNMSLKDIKNHYIKFNVSMLKQENDLNYNSLLGLSSPTDLIKSIEDYLIKLPLSKKSIQKYYDNDQLEQIALENYMSKRSLQRYFNKWFGTTPKEHIQLARQVKARHLFLSKKDNNLTEIAFILNYTDQAHFSKHFKTTYNKSPKDFKYTLSDIYKHSSFL